MAIRWAVQNGNWSSTSTWNGGTLPADDGTDDVYADGRTVFINQPINVGLLTTLTRPGGNPGGFFYVNDNITINANIIPGTTNAVTFSSPSPASFTLFGNVSGHASSVTINGINNSSSGTVNVIGLARAQAGNAILNSSNGVINLTGYVIGGTGDRANGGNGIRMFATGGILNLSGTILGAFGSSGIYLNTGGIICNIIGDINIRPPYGGPGLACVLGVGSVINMVGSIKKDNLNGYGVELQGTHTMNITGDVFQGGDGTNNFCSGIFHFSNGNINVIGNVIGQNSGAGFGGGQNQNSAIYNTNGTVFVSGSVVGGFATGAPSTCGIINAGTGSILVIGPVIGGTVINSNNQSGLRNISTGTVSITGSAIGRVSPGMSNEGGTVYVKRVVGGPGGPFDLIGGTAAGIRNTQNGTVFVEQIEFGAQGATPVTGPVFILPADNNRFIMRNPSFEAVPFFNSFEIEDLFPAPSDVRKGVVYALGDFIGTMSVPSPSAVQFDVPVDNTKGELFLRPQNFWEIPRSQITNPATIGYRLKNVATIGAVGQLIASFNLVALSGYEGPIPLPIKSQYIYYRFNDETENFKWRTAYIAVSADTNKFNVLITNLSGISLYNYFDRTNYSNCYWTLTTTPALSANRNIIRPTETATISGINNVMYTLYYFTTGSMVGGLSAAIGGISTSDINLPPIEITPN